MNPVSASLAPATHQAARLSNPRFSGQAELPGAARLAPLISDMPAVNKKEILKRIPHALASSMKAAFLNPMAIAKSAALGTVAMLVTAPFFHVLSPALIPAWVAIDMAFRGIETFAHAMRHPSVLDNQAEALLSISVSK